MKLSTIIKLSLFLTSAMFASQAAAEYVVPEQENLIFNYDVDPGVLSGEAIEAGKQIGEITGFDYSESTFVFFININETVDGWASLFHVGNNDQERYPAVWLYSNSSRLHYRVGAENYYNNNIVEEENYYLPLNEWVMITSTFSNGTASLYANDALLGRRSLDIGDNDFTSESWPIYTGNPWSFQAAGSIDNVMLYDVALSEDDIIDIWMNNNDAVSVPVGGAGLVSLYFLAGRKRRRD
jgi:hypothetical protein